MNYSRALVRCGVALGLSVAVLVLLLLPLNGTTPANVQVISINDVHVADISAVAVRNPQGAYGFILAPDGAVQLVAQPEVANADYAIDEMQAFIYQMSKLSASRAIPDPGDLRQYGLDNPQAQTTLILKDGRTLRVLLGNASPVGDQYYLRKQDDTPVYLIGKLNAELMLRARTDYWNRQLLPRIDAQAIDQLESIRLITPGLAAGNWRIAHAGNGTFHLTQPVSATLRADKVYAHVLQSLSGLRADRFVALATQTDRLPSAQPTHRLEIHIDGKRHQLAFTPNGADGYLVHPEAGAAVFALSRDNAPFITTAYRDLLGDHLYNASLASLQSVDFNGRGGHRPLQLALHETGAGVYGIALGRRIPAAQLAEALAPLFAIGIVAEVEHTPHATAQLRSALAQPVHARVVIRKRDGTQDRIEFFPKDDKHSYVRVNGATDFISYTAAADTLERSLMALRAAEASPPRSGS